MVLAVLAALIFVVVARFFTTVVFVIAFVAVFVFAVFGVVPVF